MNPVTATGSALILLCAVLIVGELLYKLAAVSIRAIRGGDDGADGSGGVCDGGCGVDGGCE